MHRESHTEHGHMGAYLQPHTHEHYTQTPRMSVSADTNSYVALEIARSKADPTTNALSPVSDVNEAGSIVNQSSPGWSAGA